MGRAQRPAPRPQLTRRSGRRRGIGDDGELRLEVDDAGVGDRLAHPRLGVVDHPGPVVRGQARLQLQPCRHQQLLGPQVHGAQLGHPGHPRGRDPAPDRLLLLGRGRLTEQQAVHLEPEDDRHHGQQRADGQGAEAVPDRVAGDRGQPDAEEGEAEPELGGGVLQQHHRQLGLLGGADERPPALPAPHGAGLPDGRAQRQPLQDQGHDQDGQGDGRRLQLVGIAASRTPRRRRTASRG